MTRELPEVIQLDHIVYVLVWDICRNQLESLPKATNTTLKNGQLLQTPFFKAKVLLQGANEEVEYVVGVSLLNGLFFDLVLPFGLWVFLLFGL